MKRRFEVERALSSKPARLLSDKPRRMLAPDAAYVPVHWRKVLSKVMLAGGWAPTAVSAAVPAVVVFASPSAPFPSPPPPPPPAATVQLDASTSSSTGTSGLAILELTPEPQELVFRRATRSALLALGRSCKELANAAAQERWALGDSPAGLVLRLHVAGYAVLVDALPPLEERLVTLIKGKRSEAIFKRS